MHCGICYLHQNHSSFSLLCKLFMCLSSDRPNFVYSMPFACFLRALCWIKLPSVIHCFWNALFSFQLEFVSSHSLLQQPNNCHWPQHSDQPLGEVSGWHQHAGIGGMWLQTWRAWEVGMVACWCVCTEWMSPRLCLNTFLHLEQTQKESHAGHDHIIPDAAPQVWCGRVVILDVPIQSCWITSRVETAIYFNS